MRPSYEGWWKVRVGPRVADRRRQDEDDRALTFAGIATWSVALACGQGEARAAAPRQSRGEAGAIPIDSRAHRRRLRPTARRDHRARRLRARIHPHYTRRPHPDPLRPRRRRRRRVSAGLRGLRVAPHRRARNRHLARARAALGAPFVRRVGLLGVRRQSRRPSPKRCPAARTLVTGFVAEGLRSSERHPALLVVHVVHADVVAELGWLAWSRTFTALPVRCGNRPLAQAVIAAVIKIAAIVQDPCAGCTRAVVS